MAINGGSAAQGAQIQVQAVGNLDAWLTLNPECTHFQQEYCRHTPFGLTETDVFSNSQPRWGATLQFDIPRAGDLMGPMFLHIQRLGLRYLDEDGLPSATAVVTFVNASAYAAITNCVLEIGSITVDQTSGEFMHLIEAFSTPVGNEQGEMIGEFASAADLRIWTFNEQVMYAKLQFFNCDHPELYLPLIALSAHAVRVKVYLLPINALVNAVTGAGVPFAYSSPPAGLTLDPAADGSIKDAALTLRLVYCDQFERNLISAEVHELLIIQHQEDRSDSVQPGAQSKGTTLSFNNAILAEWHAYMDEEHTSSTNLDAKDYFDYTIPRPASEQPPWLVGTTPIRYCPIDSFALRFNSQDRVAVRDSEYFTSVMPFLSMVKKERTRSILTYPYHFAPMVSYSSPHGSCNWSRIHEVKALFSFRISGGSSVITDIQGSLRHFVRSHNVGRVANGQWVTKFA